MINVFNFAPSDASLVFLQHLFGNMNGIIPTPANPPPGSNLAGPGVQTLNVLGVMFQIFNTVILAVATIIVIYVTVVGVMSTAHEGEFMGKKYGGIWTPIRMVLGIAALVPGGAGYSAIQMLLMWVIVQGIGAADVLWNAVVSYTANVGSPATTQISMTTNVTGSLNTLFEDLTCDATSRLQFAAPGGGSNLGYYCNGNSCQPTNPFTPNSSGVYQMGPSGSCGTLNYCTTTDSSPAGQLCQAQQAALSTIVNTFSNIATIFAKEDYDFQDFYYNSGLTTVPSTGANWSWIHNYCSSALNLNQAQCCVPPKAPQSMNPSQQSSCMINNFTPNGDTQQGANDDMVSTVYWPYGLQLKIGNIDFINTAANYYSTQMSQALTSLIASEPVNANTAQTLGGPTGWLYAGAHYFQLVSYNQASSYNNMVSDFTVTAADLSSGNVMMNYRNNFEAASTLLGAVVSSSNGNSNATSTAPSPSAQPVIPTGCGLPKAMCPLASPLSSMMSSIQSAFQQATGVGNTANGLTQTGSITLNTQQVLAGNPLVMISAAGQGLLMAVEPAFLALVTASFAIGGVLGLNGWVLGTGGFDPVYFAFAAAWFMLLGPLLIMLMGAMIFFGALLGVYVPMIPLVVFTLGVLSWFVVTIEAMVAGPIVAIGILTPSNQEHELFGKAIRGLNILFNIFLRPSLMIFGLIAAMILSSIIVTIVNTGFALLMTSPGMPWGSAGQKAGTILLGGVELFIFLFAYVALIVLVINKCFQLIGILPQRVLEWIGLQGHHGFEGDVGEVRQGAEAGGKQAAESIGRAKEAGEAGYAVQKKRQEKKKEQEAAKSGAGVEEKK